MKLKRTIFILCYTPSYILFSLHIILQFVAIIPAVIFNMIVFKEKFIEAWIENMEVFKPNTKININK